MHPAALKRLTQTQARMAEGGLSAYLPHYGFIDEHTILTYHGTLIRGFRLKGIDPEGLEPDTLHNLSRQVSEVLPQLDRHASLTWWVDRHRIQVEENEGKHPAYNLFRVKRQAYFGTQSKPLFQNSITLCLEFGFQTAPDKPLSEQITQAFLDGWEALRNDSPLAVIRSWLRRHGQRHRLIVHAHELRTYLQTIIGPTCRKVSHHLAQLQPRLLDRDGLFRALLRCVNLDPIKRRMPLPHSAPLNHWLNHSAYSIERDHLRLDQRYYVDVLTTKSHGPKTLFHMLEGLMSFPGELIISTQWSTIADARAKSLIKRQRRAFRHSEVAFSSGPMITDGYKQALSDRLDQATSEIEVAGHHFGQACLSVMVWAESLDRLRDLKEALFECFLARGLVPFDEDVGVFFAWLGLLPGCHKLYQFRKLLLTNRNFADLAPIFDRDTGQSHSPYYDGPCLAMLRTPDGKPYHLNLCHKDNLNWLGLGKIGSGKSFGLKFFAIQTLKYGPSYHFIHTIGPDYDDLARICGGRILRLDLEGSHPLSLYTLEDELTPSYLQVLLQLWQAMARTLQHDLSETELATLREKLTILFRQPITARHQRALYDLADASLKPIIAPFVAGMGRFGALFDGRIEDGQSIRDMDRFTVIDYQALKRLPELSQACMLYLGALQNRIITDPKRVGDYKYVWYDEVAELIGHADDPAAQHIRTLARTGRKHGCSLALVTQTLSDLRERGLDRLMLECASQFVFWPNDGIDPEAWRTAFGTLMTSRDIEAVRTMQPKKELLLVTTYGVHKVLQLEVDPWTQLVFESHPQVVAEKRDLFEEVGFPANIDQLLARRQTNSKTHPTKGES